MNYMVHGQDSYLCGVQIPFQNIVEDSTLETLISLCTSYVANKRNFRIMIKLKREIDYRPILRQLS